MQIHGSCHCGEITYEAEVDPQTVVLCHCSDCQRFGGTPSRAMISAAAESFLAWSADLRDIPGVPDQG